jgi:sec-independent protein translocase protein TatA
MGLGGLHIWHLLIILVIVVLIFGTKRLKSIGGDLGGAIKGFKKAVDTDDDKPEARSLESDDQDAEFPEQKKKDKSRSA